jgi:hypothetical protein
MALKQNKSFGNVLNIDFKEGTAAFLEKSSITGE